MLWIYLAIAAYFIDALVFVVDKYLLADNIPYPNAYAFFVAVLTSFALLLFPFGIYLPSFFDFLLAFISGISFFLGLVFLYHAIKEADVTEVMPAIGALTAIFTFGLSVWLLPRALSYQEIWAFVLLVGGTLMMSYLHFTNKKLVVYIFASAIGQAISFVTLKFFFELTDFVNGLFWTRVGLLIGAGLMLLVPACRDEILHTFKRSTGGAKSMFLMNKILAAAAFILLYYAIKIGDVVFINAIQGVQYVLVFFVGSALVGMFPILFKNHMPPVVPRKIIAAFLIAAGLALLFIA